jgi:hypothetical protein
MTRSYPKSIRRHLRQLALRAYETELARELVPLATKFDDWKAGKISADELSDLIHKYDRGRSRELCSRYNTSGCDDMNVVGAILRGLLKKEDIPAEVWPHIQSLVELFEQWQQEGR